MTSDFNSESIFSVNLYITHLSGRGLGGMTQWICYPPNGNRRKNNGRRGFKDVTPRQTTHNNHEQIALSEGKHIALS